MTYKELIKELDFKSDEERFEIVRAILNQNNLDYEIQEYETGKNLIVTLGNPQKYYGVSCHYDIVSGTGGANDNSSAIIVCLDIIARYLQSPLKNFGLKVFFFDQEEVGLKGSRAYVHEYGVENLAGLFNLEMVGRGDKLALWSVEDEEKNSLVELVEAVGKLNNVEVKRFDKIVTHYADHLAFREAGLKISFSITAISAKDIEVSYHYYKAQEFDVSKETLYEILSEAPLFKDYHQSTDTWEKISEESIAMVAEVVWDCLLLLENKPY